MHGGLGGGESRYMENTCNTVKPLPVNYLLPLLIVGDDEVTSDRRKVVKLYVVNLRH